MSGITDNPSRSRINDGTFEIKYQNNGVFLIVYPPVGNGKSVEIGDVVERIINKKIQDYDISAIEAAVSNASKIPIKIAEFQEEYKIDACALVSTSPDKMKAYITLNEPDGGRMLSVDELIKVLNEQGIVHGLNKNVLEVVSSNPSYNQMISVAEGTQPVNGENGKVEFYFNANREVKPTILEDGRVDFRDLNLIENVHKGQLLCSLVEPLPGKPGKTVTGVDVKAYSGKSAVLPKGKNVEISADGKHLLSSIDGQVNFVEGKVSVFALYEIPADVDNSTGNVYFIGNVSIKGNVLSGFTVEAGGNVEVWGVVEGAVIKADGDIILRRGMQGLGKGHLISGGDIIAKYIENSIVEAKDNIKAEAIMHSNVKCGNKVEVGGKKGLLVGGTCKVGREICAKVIGSPMATITDVEVGVDPTLRDRYKVLKEDITNMENDVKKADQAVTLLKKLEAAGALTPEKREIMVKSLRTKVFYSNKIEELKREMQEIDEKLKEEVMGRIKADNIVYPGTKVVIGSCMMYVKENIQHCTLYRDGADIRVGPYVK